VTYSKQDSEGGFLTAKAIHVTEVSRDDGESFANFYNDWDISHKTQTKKNVQLLTDFAVNLTKRKQSQAIKQQNSLTPEELLTLNKVDPLVIQDTEMEADDLDILNIAY